MMLVQLTHSDLVYARARARHAELLAEAATHRRASQLPPPPSRTPIQLTLPAWPTWLRRPRLAPVSPTP